MLITVETGIFTGCGGPTTTIADSSGPLSRFGARPALNDNGTVAFHAELGPDNPGIFTGSGGPTTTIADSSGPFAAFGTFPSLNNSGTVAFVGGLDGFGGFGGIFTGSGGPITTIADSSGPFGLFPSFAPSLNDSGTVAFFAELDTGGAGIFTGPDPLADEVISIGDTLFGSTVTDIFIQSDSLNDTGQLAFLYGLTDGRRGIARADPQVTPAPEPGTLPLLVAGLLGAVLWRKGKST